MAIPRDSFDSWLNKKLQALNIDESIFSSYIRGILEGDETEDEKSEILMSTLCGITVRTVWIVRLGRSRHNFNEIGSKNKNFMFHSKKYYSFDKTNIYNIDFYTYLLLGISI